MDCLAAEAPDELHRLILREGNQGQAARARFVTFDAHHAKASALEQPHQLGLAEEAQMVGQEERPGICAAVELGSVATLLPACTTSRTANTNSP